MGHTAPVRVLVLTYNRSLAGYVSALANDQVEDDDGLILRVSTFSAWAQDLLGHLPIFDDPERKSRLSGYGSALGFDDRFLVAEVDYALGRFPPAEIGQYTARDRDGRGASPRVDKDRFLTEVLLPYLDYKRTHRLQDWQDLACAAGDLASEQYDVVIVDEAQDFTANQVRAVLAHCAENASITFILDSVQRIYPNFFTWREVGLNASRFVLNTSLHHNLRNTQEIAAFARPFVSGLPVDENGQLPDLDSASRRGPMPRVFAGSFSEQAQLIVQQLLGTDLDSEDVGILHPRGYGWFDYLRRQLDENGLRYVELAGNRDWPVGPVNIGLSTLHSAKGLEFDHVIVCGVTGETAKASANEDDSNTQNLRRLLAMAFGRAKSSLLFCYDPAIPTPVVGYLDPSTYEEI